MDIDPSESEALRKKSDALRELSTGSISSSISELSGSSRVIPSEKDYHFYRNFDEFRAPIDEIGAKTQSMLQQIGSLKHFWSGKEMCFPEDVEEDAYDWLVNANDEVMERFDASVDEFSRMRKAQEEGTRGGTVVDEDGFQLVCGRNKKGLGLGGKMKEKEESVRSPPAVRVAERDKKAVGTKPKVPFHIPTIKRPQDEYSILVNNANQPFQHVWLERSEDGSRVIHPVEKLSFSDFVDSKIERLEPAKPPPLESTPFKLVEEVQDLKELASKLRSVNDFAVDLEHNQYRSFQGLTCLMQISTRTEDFVVDTLKLRIHVGPYLREVFKDPSKRKVMHGADRDMIWLQRDFGIYVCNLFDTGQASRVLQMERHSLEHLLQHFCGVTANKEYQNADWRLRPLPDEMMRYAREDTHYLLYIYDLMKIRLLSESSDPGNPDALLLEVYKRSCDVCMQLYEKELLTDTSYLYIYGVQGANLNAQQLSIVHGLCEWRDAVARVEDESTGYILPNKTLLEIAKQMPLTTGKLRRLVKSKHSYVERNLSSVVNIIRHSVQNASSFEAVAVQLKEGQVEQSKEDRTILAPDLYDAEADFPEVHTAGDYSGEFSVGSQHEHVPAPLLANEKQCKRTDHDSNPSKSRGGAFSGDVGKHCNLRKDINGCITYERQREGLLFSRQKNEMDTSFLHSEKIAEATIQMLKKPNRSFGALLGCSASKKKTDFSKEKADDKLVQIKSSVNLPFYSFSHSDQQSKQSSKQASEEPNRVSDNSDSGDHPTALALTSNSEDIILLDGDRRSNQVTPESRTLDTLVPEDQVTAPGSSVKPEDIILLDSDSNDETLPDRSAGDEGPVNAAVHQETSQPELVILDEDEDEDEDEPMSLSDLSSSFQKCLQSTSLNQTTQQGGKSEEAGCLQFKPFNYEAARKEVKFGEVVEGEMKTGDDDGMKKQGKKKGRVDVGKQDESLLPQGRRRQAFPASGNRSATFS